MRVKRFFPIVCSILHEHENTPFFLTFNIPTGANVTYILTYILFLILYTTWWCYFSYILPPPAGDCKVKLGRPLITPYLHSPVMFRSFEQRSVLTMCTVRTIRVRFKLRDCLRYLSAELHPWTHIDVSESYAFLPIPTP